MFKLHMKDPGSAITHFIAMVLSMRRLMRQTEQMPSVLFGAMGLPQSAQRVLLHL